MKIYERLLRKQDITKQDWHSQGGCIESLRSDLPYSRSHHIIPLLIIYYINICLLSIYLQSLSHHGSHMSIMTESSSLGPS